MTGEPRPLYISSLVLLLPLFLLPFFVQLLLVVLFAMFLYFRNPPAPADNVSNFFNGFRLGGHRGSPLNAPENTMVSFKQALREGVDLVEFDIGLTRDGVPVLMHDDTLDRTTNMSGLLRDHDFSELAAECNCAANFTRPRGVDLLPDEPQPDGRVPICTLEEVVQWAKEKNVKMLFDVKDSDTKLIDKIEEVFEQYDLFDCALVCSFYPWVIYRIKRQNNRILTGVTWRRRFISYTDLEMKIARFSHDFVHQGAVALDALLKWSIKIFLPQFVGADMVLIERGEIYGNFVEDMHNRGLRVCAWTVNDTNEMIWMAQKLKIPFLTDRPLNARHLLDAADGVNNAELALN